MNRLVSFLVLLVLSARCGRNSTGRPSTIAFPPEYEILASELSESLKPSPEELRNDFASSEFTKRLTESIARLESIKSDDPDIANSAERLQRVIRELLSMFNELESLSNDKTIRWWDVVSQTHQVLGIIQCLDKVESCWKKYAAIQPSLSRIAQKYAATPSDNRGRIIVDMDVAWGSHGPDDRIKLFNKGSDELGHCTIQVDLIGKGNDRRTVVHFIRYWPANSWIYGLYAHGGKIPSHPEVGRTKVADLQIAQITIWSPKYTTTIEYQYAGKEKDKDISGWCRDLSLSGRYQPFVSRFVWSTERSVAFTLDGIESIPGFQADVTFRKGPTEKAWSWKKDGWKKWEKKSFTPPRGQLTFDPTHVEIAVSFPDTDYRHQTTLEVK